MGEHQCLICSHITSGYEDTEFHAREHELKELRAELTSALEREAWLLRLLKWCRPRLSKNDYRTMLDEYAQRERNR